MKKLLIEFLDVISAYTVHEQLQMMACMIMTCNEQHQLVCLLAQLCSDDFRRGCTRFYHQDHLAPEVSVVPAAGVGLIFRQPPAAEYTHDGDKVCDGTKYLIRTDVMYRRREQRE